MIHHCDSNKVIQGRCNDVSQTGLIFRTKQPRKHFQHLRQKMLFISSGSEIPLTVKGVRMMTVELK